MSTATDTQVGVTPLGGASDTSLSGGRHTLGGARDSRSVTRSGAASLSGGRHTLGGATDFAYNCCYEL
jgi:hypothetical protein